MSDNNDQSSNNTNIGANDINFTRGRFGTKSQELVVAVVVEEINQEKEKEDFLLPYKHEEETTREIIGWYEYQIADNIRRYVPVYEESDRARAKQFWKKNWDDLAEDWVE